MAAQATGHWIAFDDTDGRPKSIIEIYEADGRYFGKVVELLTSAEQKLCTRCPGELQGQPIVGMTILTDLRKSIHGGEDGRILDPASGNSYACYIRLISPDTLKLRGYIGLPAFGRTQIWTRKK